MKKTRAQQNLAGGSWAPLGFPLTTMGFLQALEDNNNAEWFDANRSRYHAEVVAPLKAFIADLVTPLQMLNPNLDVSYKVNTTVMRINRDRRFAKNAPPYRNYVKVSFPLLGHKWSSDPVLGFGVFPRYFYVAFRNCGDQRKDFIMRQETNLKEVPSELQRWIDHVNKESRLVLFSGDHDDIRPGPAVPRTTKAWLAMEEPTIGRIWSREEVSALGSQFNAAATSDLCRLYFLKLLAVSQNPQADVSEYFKQVRRLSAILAQRPAKSAELTTPRRPVHQRQPAA